MLSDVLSHAEKDLDGSLERLFSLLRIPSISTDPAYAPDCEKAAEWCADTLRDQGFEASVRPTEGRPMVVGHYKRAEGGPHILFYGHYDVQPVDPLDLWEHDPFDPELTSREDGRQIIRARGASDDKGQLMTFVEAARAWMNAKGELPLSVTVLLEGEEESGSPSLEPFLEANADELKADIALVCDTQMWNRKTPGITTLLRGLFAEEITITAPNRDLHSGMYGGAARNPIHLLVDILSGLHDQNGRVTLAGFYDGVSELPADVRSRWAGLDFSTEAFLGDVGLAIPAGEPDYSALEQTWSRPTLEVNGINGGYIGDGFKTVIPSQASAKVSCRLVGEQDPLAIRAAFRAYVNACLPPDCSVDFIEHGASPAISLPLDSPALRKASEALDAEWGVPPVLLGCGGSIPIVGRFKDLLGMDSLLIGFALDDDQVHSPNEKYELTSYQRGIQSWVRIIGSLGK